MRKRFAVTVSHATPEQDKQFIEWLGKDRGWWHWVSNLWLIIDLDGELTAESLIETARQFFPQAYNFVIELRDDGTQSWAGFIPNEGFEKSKIWLTEYWNP